MAAVGQMQKSEKSLPLNKKKLKKQVEETNRKIMDAWRAEQAKLVEELTRVVENHAPRRKSNA